MFDEHHERRSVDLLRDEESMKWTAKQLHMSYVCRTDSKSLSPVQTIGPSKIANSATPFFSRKATFTDTIESPLSYVWPSWNDYGAHFDNIPILDIMEDMMSSILLEANFRVVYIRYIRDCQDEDRALRRASSFCKAGQGCSGDEGSQHQAPWRLKFLCCFWEAYPTNDLDGWRVSRMTTRLPHYMEMRFINIPKPGLTSLSFYIRNKIKSCFQSSRYFLSPRLSKEK